MNIPLCLSIINWWMVLNIPSSVKYHTIRLRSASYFILKSSLYSLRIVMTTMIPVWTQRLQTSSDSNLIYNKARVELNNIVITAFSFDDVTYIISYKSGYYVNRSPLLMVKWENRKTLWPRYILCHKHNT